MDIIRAFIHYNGSLLIYISGLYGIEEAQKLAHKFRINFIDINDYFLKINNGYDKNPFSYKQLYIDKINADIKELVKTGLIIYGFPILDNSLAVKVNFHIHVYITSQQYIDYWKNKYPSFDNDALQTEYTKHVKPYYTNLVKNLRIDKFIKTNKFDKDKLFEEMYDNLWDISIKMIKKWFIKTMDKNEKKYKLL